VLSYVQGGVAEVWKDNMLDKITKRTLLVTTVEELFTKIRQEFGEFDKESSVINCSFHQVYFIILFLFLLLSFSIYSVGNSVTPM